MMGPDEHVDAFDLGHKVKERNVITSGSTPCVCEYME